MIEKELAKEYLDYCRTLGFQISAKLEQRKKMLAKAIYSSPNFEGASGHTGVSDKVQNITNEILLLDQEVERFQNHRLQVLKTIVLIDDPNIRNVTADFYFNCFTYTRISRNYRISKSTLKRRLKKGVEEIEKILNSS